MRAQEKRCSHCKAVKPLSEFNKCKSGVFGRHHNCRKCDNAIKRKAYQNNKVLYDKRAKVWRDKNRDRLNKKSRENYAENKPYRKMMRNKANQRVKMAAIAKYGGKCMCCSETEPMFLTIDHINNDGKEHRAKLSRNSTQIFSGQTFYRWLRRNGYPQDIGLQVLCFNCNMGKLFNKGVCPHNEKGWI